MPLSFQNSLIKLNLIDFGASCAEGQRKFLYNFKFHNSIFKLVRQPELKRKTKYIKSNLNTSINQNFYLQLEVTNQNLNYALFLLQEGIES